MATNLEAMKKVSRLALMKEIVEKTKSCGLIWNQISPSQYLARYLDYDFFVARTSPKIYNFDVLKDGKMYRSYNSSTQEGVDILFNEIELSYGDNNIEKFKNLGNFLGRLGNCHGVITNVYTIPILGYGVLGGGDVEEEQLRPLGSPATLTPISLTFGPSPSPWTGSLSDIATNDAGATYIRQEISGEFPTNWGYAFLEFDISPVINLIPPYTIRIQVSHKREANNGVYLNLDLLINGAIVFSKAEEDSYESTTSFVLEDTGLQLAAAGPTYLDSVILRLYMFTNTGNLDPRAIQIDYATVSLNGYEQIT
jgi:hypothetical protein